MYNQFDELPISTTVYNRWKDADQATLKRAQQKIVSRGGNPYVFCADERHFYQFADEADEAAKAALTPEEHDALLGPDWNDDWDRD